MNTKRILLAIPLLAWAAVARAQAPNVATYQGRLQENGLPVNAPRVVEIRLCSSIDPNAVPSSQCFPAPGSAVQNVNVVNGVFKATFTIPSPNNVVLSSGPWFLEVAVGPDAGQLNTLAPRETLTSIPYAVYASSAEMLTGYLDPSQVGIGKLNTNVVATSFDTGKIITVWLHDSAVQTTKLAPDAVDTTKILTDSVTAPKILSAAVQTSKLAPDAVTTVAILDAAIQTSKMGTDSVNTGAILGGAVNSAKIAFGAIDTNRMGTDAVTTNKILNLNVTTAKLATGAVQTAKLANDAVTAPAILDGAVQTTKLSTDTVVTASILNGAVQTSKLGSGAVDTTKLAIDAIATFAILDGAVQTSKLGVAAVNTPALSDNAITAPKFATGALLQTGAFGGLGLDKLGALTRMGAIQAGGAGASGLQVTNVGQREHVEMYFQTPALTQITNLQIVFNGLVGFIGGYSVTRSTFGPTVNWLTGETGASGVNLIDNSAGQGFPVGSVVQVRVVLDGNLGTPATVVGRYEGTAYLAGGIQGFAVQSFHGSFAVNTGGSPIISMGVVAVCSCAALPSGAYLGVYGENFP